MLALNNDALMPSSPRNFQSALNYLRVWRLIRPFFTLSVILLILAVICTFLLVFPTFLDRTKTHCYIREYARTNSENTGLLLLYFRRLYMYYFCKIKGSVSFEG